MKILAIETSCDETAIAIVEASGGLDNPKFQVLSKSINSQIDIHKEYGGVFPTLAKREHARNIVPVLEQCFLQIRNKKSEIRNLSTLLKVNKLEISNSKPQKQIKKILEREPDLYEATINFLEEYEKPEIDMITVTEGPGLTPALWVGINFARALSIAWQIPLIGVNHMEGHITSVLIKQKQEESENNRVEFPALALLISGGHTELVEIENWNKYKILGKTRDDAVGESYDKVARLMGLQYPGGPKISAMAEKFRNTKSSTNNEEIKFPRPMITSKDLDFSFSGLKTSVLYKIKELSIKENPLSEETKEEISGEFEQAVVDVLKNKTHKALENKKYNSLIVAGGVIANKFIRENLKEVASKNNVFFFIPELPNSTDNAQMIASAGYFKSFKENPKIGQELKAIGGLTY